MQTATIPITRPGSVTSAIPQSLLDINAAEFASHFSREPFLIGHRLCSHPLFEVERLLALAQRMPARCIEYNAGELPVSIEHAQTPMNGLSAEETIRRIAECKSWIVLKYVEQDPEYGALLQECLREVRPHSEPIAPGMCAAQAFVFLTSPNSVTPYHIDPEHNFLLQIRGSKTIHLYDGRDRNLLSEEHLEDFYCDRGRNMKFESWYDEKAWVFNLPAGQGLHFPVTYPHWVQNSDDISISFSITFRTPDLDRRRALYQMHDSMRQRGWKPAPVGQRPLCDSALYNASRIWRRMKRLVGRGEPVKEAKTY
ncbi:MAG: cupin-like domain-containing protein [Planctomycetaceae bacterium]